MRACGMTAIMGRPPRRLPPMARHGDPQAPSSALWVSREGMCRKRYRSAFGSQAARTEAS